MKSLLVLLALSGAALAAADLSGDWIAEVSAKGVETQYARVKLKQDGDKLSGTWNQANIQGAVLNGGAVTLELPANGALKGNFDGVTIKGSGTMAMGGRGGGGRGRMEAAAFTLSKPTPAPGTPRTIDFEPKEFHGYYSAAIPPALKISPGDTVRTRTYDASGRDDDKRTPGGNLENGPFYIEGALPGDTLVVKLNRVRLNRDSARQGTRINGRAVTPASVAAAVYDNAFDGEWKLDREKNVAMLAHPTARLKDFTVPILPMIGCISTAPAGEQVFRGTDLGPYGGNMDYNYMGEGVTLYLPVFHPGALLTMGDAHAAMGDGELTGSALETSVDVDFTVGLVKGYASAGPRLENAEYIMAMGIAGSVPDSIQAATSQLADWLKHDYHLNDSEVAIVLGTIVKYDIAELVDPQFNVVAKVPKAALRRLQ